MRVIEVFFLCDSVNRIKSLLDNVSASRQKLNIKF